MKNVRKERKIQIIPGFCSLKRPPPLFFFALREAKRKGRIKIKKVAKMKGGTF